MMLLIMELTVPMILPNIMIFHIKLPKVSLHKIKISEYLFVEQVLKFQLLLIKFMELEQH